VGDDRSNGPFDELQDHVTNDPSNRNGRRGQLYSGLLTEYSDGCADTACWRSIEGWVDVSAAPRAPERSF